MYLVQIGQKLKGLRKSKGLTQGQLASMSGIARETISRIEGGTCSDLGLKRLLALLELLDGELSVGARTTADAKDHVQRAVASVNARDEVPLRPDDLVRALLTGRIPAGKDQQIRSLMRKLAPASRINLIQQVDDIASAEGRAAKGAVRLSDKLKI